MTDESVASQGGCGAHEIRTWIAAFACLSAFGSYTAQTAFYRPIPEWIAGFALVNAALN
jgi:2,3-dihydroxyphenylpropionate 1,2-dioxygenase